MSGPEIAGYVASLLVFATFWMKTLLPLRICGIISNVAFISYALLAGLHPILILHAALLPLNLWRLYAFAKLVRDAEAALLGGDLSFASLAPFMHPLSAKAGATLFRVGDPPDKIYYIKAGRVVVSSFGFPRGPGDTVGEAGLLLGQQERMATAVCETDCELLWMSVKDFLRVMLQEPRFGLQLMRLVARRQLRDLEKLRAAGGLEGPAS